MRYNIWKGDCCVYSTLSSKVVNEWYRYHTYRRPRLEGLSYIEVQYHTTENDTKHNNIRYLNLSVVCNIRTMTCGYCMYGTSTIQPYLCQIIIIIIFNLARSPIKDGRLRARTSQAGEWRDDWWFIYAFAAGRRRRLARREESGKKACNVTPSFIVTCRY